MSKCYLGVASASVIGLIDKSLNAITDWINVTFSFSSSDISPTGQGVDHRRVQKELGDVVVTMHNPVVLSSTSVQVTWAVSTYCIKKEIKGILLCLVVILLKQILSENSLSFIRNLLVGFFPVWIARRTFGRNIVFMN